ncbi:unnamed protein product [Miscanthus lutarioriparius]|uniref:NB-ARC domain-containing protein n=1 Tax=Miscanthus lutarioriparius TaxID=422564 RepID=A0A811QFZ3_9POAL|nr:unnamed protein product [Miscanthus lutarioriparius]
MGGDERAGMEGRGGAESRSRMQARRCRVTDTAVSQMRGQSRGRRDVVSRTRDAGVESRTPGARDAESQCRYLIVIDDVDDIEEGQWDTITSAFEGNGEGSRIMVTTTFRPTANRRSDTNGCVYKMRTLGMKDSMTIALRGRSAAELVQGSETLLKKCDGLPLALVSVASKPGSYLEREDGEPNFARLRDVLIENYTSLSDLTVRTCLLYLGIFPIDRPLRKNVIIRRWMAEGYARSEDITLSEQSVANGNLKTFIDRNIILPVKISKNAEVKTCKAHAIIHEFLLHRSMCEKFIMCSSRDKIVRHIFVHGDVGSDTNSTETWNMDLSRVRSLTVRRSAGCSISDFGKYKLIRVLDLEECTDMKDSHLKKICKLWNLRYLSLSHDITRLPKEIAKLKLLETLALSKTVVTTLPVEVIGLPCLTNLIGKNSKMETLAGLVVDTGQLQGLLHLTLHMKNLRKVKIWFESTEVIDDFSDFNNDLVKAIRQYTRAPLGAGCVRSMSIDFQGLPDGTLHALQDLYNESMSLQEKYYLSSLKLYGDLSTSHEFVAIVSGLTKLCLSSATMARGLLLSLSAMPFLLYLTLITDEIKDFIITAGAFQSLRRLRFVLQHQNPVLPKIEEGALPELVSLQVPSMNLAAPSGIEIRHLRMLQEIELHPKLSKHTRQEWEAAAWNHPNRPNVLPFISIDDLVVDGPTDNLVVSPKKSGLEEVVIQGQLLNNSGPCVGDIPLSTCNNSGLGNEMDFLPNHVTLENPISIQERPAMEASKDSLLLTDQQGKHTSTELGHASSCYNSAILLNTSNCALQLHANGLVNDDLR